MAETRDDYHASLFPVAEERARDRLEGAGVVSRFGRLKRNRVLRDNAGLTALDATMRLEDRAGLGAQSRTWDESITVQDLVCRFSGDVGCVSHIGFELIIVQVVASLDEVEAHSQFAERPVRLICELVSRSPARIPVTGAGGRR